MALLFPEHRLLNEQGINIQNSTIIQLRDNPEQTSFDGIPYKDISILFVEGSKTEDQDGVEPFGIPTNYVWARTYAANREELEQFLISPHLHVPRIFFSINPNTAIKLAIQHIFSIAYGTSMEITVRRLSVTDPCMFKHFETFNKINITVWKGQNIQVPPQLSDTFSQQILTARSQILTQTGKKFLYFTSVMRRKLGIFLDVIAPLRKDMALKVTKFITRSNPVNCLSSLQAMQCNLCTTDFDSYDELESHFTECASRFDIQASGLTEHLSYVCNKCDTTPMSYFGMVVHINTFCITNFRAVCPYCNSVSKTCQCAKNKLDEISMLNNIRLNCRPYDLVYDKNLYYLVAWLESTRMCQTPADVSCSSSLKDLDFNMKIQCVNEILFLLIKTASGHRNADFETITNVLASNNVSIPALKSLCGDQIDFYKEVPPQICSICWETINGISAQHLAACHPSCYCTDKNFQSPGELLEHFKEHSLRGQKCPVCPQNFETLFDAISHLENHQSSVLHRKAKCDVDLGLPLCSALDVDGFQHLRHILTFHITNREFLKSVLNNSLKLVQGFYNLAQNDRGAINSSSSQNGQVSSLTEQAGASLADLLNHSSKLTFKCPNQECLVTNVSFTTQQELDNHIKNTHKCMKPACLFFSPDPEILWTHIQSHMSNFGKVFVCTLCAVDFPDESSLREHNSIAHYLKCIICGDTSHRTRASLNDHMRNCNRPTFPAAIQPSYLPAPGSTQPFPVATNEPLGNQQPLILLVDALANTNIADKASLQHIKSVIMRQDTIAKHLETKISGDKHFVEIPIFSAGPSLSIPNSRLKDLPKFYPVDDKPLTNYISFEALITELNCLVTEFFINESQYVNLLLQQIGPSAKAHLKSVLNVSTNVRNVPLEKVLETSRVLFYDVDLSAIYTQSTNLQMNPGESIIAFFARADKVTKLASHYLDDPNQAENFRSSNLRLQFLNAAGKRFSDFIRKKELTQIIIYSPTELLRIFLEWSKCERNNSQQPGLATINNVADLSIENIIPGSKPPSRGRGRSGGRGKRGRKGNNPAPERSQSNVSQVTAPTTSRANRSQSAPVRYKESSLQKRRALNVSSNQPVCFLCGDPHFPRACRTYPNARVQDTPCSHCRFYHESSLCQSGRNNTARPNSSHN